MEYFAHFLLFLAAPLFFEGIVSYMKFTSEIFPTEIEDEFFEADHNWHPEFIQFMLLLSMAGTALVCGTLLLRGM